MNLSPIPFQLPSFLTCLHHDQRASLLVGGGTRHSIFRFVRWNPRTTGEPDWHDFCVVWDYRRDPRIFRVVERLHGAGLLDHVFFVGEASDVLTILVDEDFKMARSAMASLRAIAGELDTGPLTLDLGYFVPHAPHQSDVRKLAQDPRMAAVLFLDSVHRRWRLGHKPRRVIVPRMAVALTAPGAALDALEVAPFGAVDDALLHREADNEPGAPGVPVQAA
jgi:hypothetical protein